LLLFSSRLGLRLALDYTGVRGALVVMHTLSLYSDLVSQTETLLGRSNVPYCVKRFDLFLQW